MSQNHPPALTKSELDKELRIALNGLYDPTVLHSSPLTFWLNKTQPAKPMGDLQRVLLDGIEALRPQAATPSGSKTWRVYQILRRRYTEQTLQRQVADDLGVSLRQLQREEKIAREVLRDHLWKVYHLSDRPLAAEADSSSAPAKAADLAWLRDTLPVQSAYLNEIMQEALLTLQSVLRASEVAVDYQFEECSSPLYLQPVLLRQGLLNLLNFAIAHIPGGKLIVHTQQKAGAMQITISAQASAAKFSSPAVMDGESLAAARSFIELCQGSLAVANPADGSAFAATVLLPVAERLKVLCIEDHPDTLQLLQRYLADSRYCFMGASSARQGVALAVENSPDLIVVDVMMPDSDGWAVLGQLRVHPKTQRAPVIVCSIVPQANLAFSLGAAEFLHKPINQAELLACLDRQAARLQKETG